MVKGFFLTTIVGVESDLHLLAIFSDRVLFKVCYQNLHDTVKKTLNYGAVVIKRFDNDSVGPHVEHQFN